MDLSLIHIYWVADAMNTQGLTVNPDFIRAGFARSSKCIPASPLAKAVSATSRRRFRARIKSGDVYKRQLYLFGFRG